MSRLRRSESLRAFGRTSIQVIILNIPERRPAAGCDRRPIAPPPAPSLRLREPAPADLRVRDASPRRVEDFAKAGTVPSTRCARFALRPQPQLQALDTTGPRPPPWRPTATDRATPPRRSRSSATTRLPGRVPVRGRRSASCTSSITPSPQHSVLTPCRSIERLLRRREQISVVERHLTKRFHVRHLKAADRHRRLATPTSWTDCPSAMRWNITARRLLGGGSAGRSQDATSS